MRGQGLCLVHLAAQGLAYDRDAGNASWLSIKFEGSWSDVSSIVGVESGSSKVLTRVWQFETPKKFAWHSSVMPFTLRNTVCVQKHVSGSLGRGTAEASCSLLQHRSEHKIWWTWLGWGTPGQAPLFTPVPCKKRKRFFFCLLYSPPSTFGKKH